MSMIKSSLEMTPPRPNGLTIVYLLGYGGSIWHSKRHLNLLKNEGYQLYVLDFKDVLKRRDPQDLIRLMDEVDERLKSRNLIAKTTTIVGVSMGGLIGFNMLKRHAALDKLLVITGGNMALIPGSFRQKWPISYSELAKTWANVNIYTSPGEVRGKSITMMLPSRDKMINPNEVTGELRLLEKYNTIKVLRPKGGHFRTIITQTVLSPKSSLALIRELTNRG